MLPKITNSLSKLIFPTLCFMCGKISIYNGNSFCTSCKFNMPYTNHFEVKDNAASLKFWGKFPCEYAASYLNFYSYSNVKYMMHSIKYQGRKDIATKFGYLAGLKALDSGKYNNIDLIVPIPLHKLKESKRGYNQSQKIAIGIAEVLGKPINTTALIKDKQTPSQTKKGRLERVQNVMKTFKNIGKSEIEGRHILLIDDVLTTGATIEAAAIKLLESRDVKLSVLTVCIARN